MAWPSDSARTKNWGAEVLASNDLEAQLDLLHTWVNDAMDATTGHDHSGGANEGPKIVLTAAAGVSGVLPSDNGGTEADLSAAAQGALPYFASTGVMAALAAGTSGYFLKTQGAGANPAWVANPVFGWAKFDSDGTVAASSNVTSVTDNGTGDFSVNWTTACSDANYAVSVVCRRASGGVYVASIISQSTTVLRVLCKNESFNAVDPDSIYVIAIR